uniref:Thiamine-monophosphate kinase n=1 Tax=Fervidicoccus fontis TaxID=683846 RepID=A0A7J3ZKQ7_9CREN
MRVEGRALLQELGEDRVVEWLTEKTSHVYPKKSRLPLGDDAAEIDDTGIIVSIDGYSLAYSKYEWEDWSDWGWRSVVSSISDLVSKGARPVGVLVSIGLERTTELDVLDKVYDGILDALERYEVYLLGGDTNASTEKAWISVASIGFATTKPIPRSGARSGDKVYTTLKNGYGLSGLIWKLYTSTGLNPREVLGSRAILRPEVPLEFLEVVKKVRVTASVDVSDGLSKSLYLIAGASKKKIVVRMLPGLPDAFLESTAIRYGISVRDCVLYGGEEYETVFTSPEGPDVVLRACEEAGLECAYLGDVVEGEATVVSHDGRKIDYGGYDQFRGY